MNILNQFLIIIVFFICSCEVICAQEVNYLEQAYELYGVGKYEQAQKALNMYSFMTGSQDKALEERIRYCLNFQTLARQAELTGDYITAKLYYEGILKYNSQDTQVNATISKLNALIKKQSNAMQTSQTKSSQLRVGDYYDTGTGRKGRIAYLDYTGQHGFILVRTSNNPIQRHEVFEKLDYATNERIPTINELKVIYNNRKYLGLFETYWSSTIEKKENQWYTYNIGFCYDFSSGKEIKTKLPKREKFHYIIIVDF